MIIILCILGFLNYAPLFPLTSLHDDVKFFSSLHIIKYVTTYGVGVMTFWVVWNTFIHTLGLPWMAMSYFSARNKNETLHDNHVDVADVKLTKTEKIFLSEWEQL